jgi:type III pantothenate kinase
MIFNLSKTNIKKNQFVTSRLKRTSMLLAIDVGNTRIKGAVFEHNTLLESFVFLKETLRENLENILRQFPDCTDLVVASVGDIEKEAFRSVENNLQIHFITPHDRFPFRNLYETPYTLGIDRMVLATGAVLQFPKQNRLVIDAGTCVTYDFIDSENNYLGGAISPGVRLRYESLHRYTAKLPLLTRENPAHFIGNSTSQSIHSGIIEGLIHEIDGFISQYEQQYPNFIIILTGGDADFLAKRLKNTIFANSNFLLESLNQTFQYKITHD